MITKFKRGGGIHRDMQSLSGAITGRLALPPHPQLISLLRAEYRARVIFTRLIEELPEIHFPTKVLILAIKGSICSGHVRTTDSNYIEEH